MIRQYVHTLIRRPDDFAPRRLRPQGRRICNSVCTCITGALLGVVSLLYKPVHYPISSPPSTATACLPSLEFDILSLHNALLNFTLFFAPIGSENLSTLFDDNSTNHTHIHPNLIQDAVCHECHPVLLLLVLSFPSYRFATAAIAAILSLAALVQAAPTAVVDARSPAATCVLTAVASNGEDVGGPFKGKRQVTTFTSSTAIQISRKGSNKPFWVNGGFNVWDISKKVIKSSDTGLAMDLTYWSAGGAPTFSCKISYNSITHNCVQSDKIVHFDGSEDDQYGAATFPCSWKPGKEPPM